MLKSERRQHILRQLQRDGVVHVSHLEETLHVSPVTIRRDLAALEAQGHLHRVHGGAIHREGEVAVGLTDRLAGRIAQAAAGFIPNHSVIFLAPGTLTQEMVPFLHRQTHLTIVTNALNIAWSVAQQPQPHTLHIFGGQVHTDGGIYGDADALQRVRVDWVILEAHGLDAARGLTHDDRNYADVVRSLFGLTAQVMVLAEPRALEQAGALFIAPASALDLLITGREASNSFLWDLSELGVRIVLA